MIRVLRPAAEPLLVSARVFDDAFARSLHPDVAVELAGLADLLDDLFGSGPPRIDATAAEAFREATNGFDFVCPNYRAIPFAPLLVALRNRGGSHVRLLLIAHAPGVYCLEWALLRPLLRPGDLVVAPSHNAAEAIDYLCPEITPHVRVIPHPIPPLPGTPPARGRRLVSLSRIHPWKVLHRQIEAMAILRKRGVRDLTMRLAGPLTEPGQTCLTPYARTLASKIERLGLTDAVELVGQIDGDAAKAAFLDDARVLLNLSATVEESFSKSSVEALSRGVPVLATRWDGLPETVGAAGVCVAVDLEPLGVDLPAERLADSIQAVLDGPPSVAECRAQAARSLPERVRSVYCAELEKAVEVSGVGAGPEPDWAAAAPGGLLGVTAPLTNLAWSELFALHLADTARLRQSLAGGALAPTAASEAADQLRALLTVGTRAPLERFFAHQPDLAAHRPVGRALPRAAVNGDFLETVAQAATARATRSSRTACLGLLAVTGRRDAVQVALDAAYADGLRSEALRYWEIDALRQAGRYQRAFQLAVELEDGSLSSELASHRVRQLAAVCREWSLPGLALPWLQGWLERYPDAADAGLVWVDLATNAAAVGGDLLPEARRALEWATRLLGDAVDLRDLEAAVEKRPTHTEAALVG